MIESNRAIELYRTMVDCVLRKPLSGATAIDAQMANQAIHQLLMFFHTGEWGDADRHIPELAARVGGAGPKHGRSKGTYPRSLRRSRETKPGGDINEI